MIKKITKLTMIAMVMILMCMAFFVPNTAVVYAEDASETVNHSGVTSLNWRSSTNGTGRSVTITLSANLDSEQESALSKKEITILWENIGNGVLKDGETIIDANDISGYTNVVTIVCTMNINDANQEGAISDPFSILPTPEIAPVGSNKDGKFFRYWTADSLGETKINQSDSITKKMNENTEQTAITIYASYKKDPGGVIRALKTVTLPIIIALGSFGMLYVVILGINLAKADSTDAREQAKKRMVNALIGLVVVILLFVLLFLYASNYDIVHEVLSGVFKNGTDVLG